MTDADADRLGDALDAYLERRLGITPLVLVHASDAEQIAQERRALARAIAAIATDAVERASLAGAFRALAP